MAADLGLEAKQRYERAAENQTQVAGEIRNLFAFLTKEQAGPLIQEATYCEGGA